jgi:drug/metabolite transporter (DMT)-like permease
MGYLCAICAFLIWGIASTVILRAIPLPGPAASCAGALVGSAAMLAWIGPGRWREVASAWRTHGWRLVGLSAAFAGCSLTYQWSVKMTTVANAVLTHSFQPFMTCLLFVPLWGGERPTIKGWLALVVGIAGLAIVLAPELSLGATNHLWGAFLGAASAAFFAWYNVQVPTLQDRMPQHILHTAIVLGAAALCLPALFFVGPVTFGPKEIGATLAFGLLSFAFANVLFFKAIRLAPVGHVATLAYLEPIVSITAAALLLDEPAHAGVWLGGGLILASGALVVYDRPPRLKTT